MSESKSSEYLFSKALRIFLIEINGLSESLPVIMKSLTESRHDSEQKINQFFKEHGELIEKVEEDKNGNKKKAEIYKVSFEYSYDIGKLIRTYSNFSAASSIISNGLLVMMISQFDAFLGRLIKAMYYAKPEMLNASEKQLTFANLVQFGSVEAAREFLLEKEIESVLRESHAEHFEWLEKKLGIPLRKELDIWTTFIEMTERRNLFVHTNGIVSSQYITVCRSHGVAIKEDLVVGKKLHVSEAYLQEAYEVLFELATKLTHVVWRKLIPSELSIADTKLNDVCYELLKEENYSIAKRILSFAMKLPRYSSQQDKLIFIINSAIAYKWGGESERAQKLISETDWSACNNAFKLASTVLSDQFDEAAKIMKTIGNAGEVTKNHYKEWPVFRDFRHSPQFSDTYREVFGEDFETVKVSSGSEIDDQDNLSFSVQGDDESLCEDFEQLLPNHSSQ
ncbi:MAG: hypothetical protein ACHWZW_15820 [Spirulina sp.]